MKPYRSISHRTPAKTNRTSSIDLNSSHIVQQSLDKKDALLNKYQTEINDLIEQIDSKQPYRRANERKKILNTDTQDKRKRAISSLRKQTANLHMGQGLTLAESQSLKDYQKLILGLEFALETQKKKNEELAQKNVSLETQISNLRNILMGPNQQKYYEKTAIKEHQEKINYLQGRIIEQKKQYEFIIDSKTEETNSLEKQIKILQREIKDDPNNDRALARKLSELGQELEELQSRLTRKNIQIERLKYQNSKDDDSDDEEVVKIRKAERLKFYLTQLQISNKMILRKNTEILQLTNKIMLYEKILDTIELYLDKKDVKNTDLSILEHPCVNKLRILLRQKAVFQRQLLNQLNDHNKKIALFETQITGRDKYASDKLTQVINDNKRLASTVNNLQSNIGELEKELDNEKKQNEFLNNQIVINKKQFVDEVNKLKEQLEMISSVTKNEFDRMKIQNLKLTEQNRSLLFLVGEKQREIHKKGEAIKTFEEYRQKINTLNVGEKEKRKIELVSEDHPQIGTKLLLINNFSNWLFEWNKIKNWANKKTLLNLILDKDEIKGDSLTSLPYVITVIHDCFLVSKNIEIQQRATILLAYYVPHKILSHQNIYLSKLVPTIIKGLRPIIQGEQASKHNMLNQSALKILNELEKINFKWSHEMTNEMLSINGLKYIFDLIRNSKADDLVESCYNVLIMIAKQNQMISFMMSYDINTIIFNNLTADSTFVIFTVTLLKNLLEGEDYLKLQKSVIEFKKLFDILNNDDDETLVELVLDCIELLMQKSVGGFVKPLDKMKSISILSKMLKKNHEETTYNILKKVGSIYSNLVTELDEDRLGKYVKVELDNLLELIRQKRLNEPRFSRAIKIIEKLTPVFYETPEFDNKVLPVLMDMYSLNEQMQSSLRLKVSKIVFLIYKRNPQYLDKFTNETFITNLVQTYKLCHNIHEEIILLLNLILFQCEQKRVIQILKCGRQSMISKLIQDSLISDYGVTIGALKVLLILSKEKFVEKFLNSNLISSLVNKVLNERGEEEYIGIALSIIYFLCKIETVGSLVIDAGGVPRILNVILERHDKQPLIFKCLAVLEVLNTIHYKKKVLSHLIAKESNLQVLKVLNFALRKAKNKVQLGTRSIFIYDYLNSKIAMESLALLTERNEWIIEDLVMLRNQFIKKVDSLVYKIELLLHEMSKVSNKVKKLYQKYKVEGDSSEDDD